MEAATAAASALCMCRKELVVAATVGSWQLVLLHHAVELAHLLARVMGLHLERASPIMTMIVERSWIATSMVMMMTRPMGRGRTVNIVMVPVLLLMPLQFHP